MSEQEMSLTVGSLFSGIGGLDLGLERAGMNVIWQSEIDPYACKVLKKHWPKVVNHGDIKSINWGDIVRPDVICGGYPCQPFSTAGLRKGEQDPRHLWPWVRQAISELRPKYAILENVRGHLSMGGMSVVGELASIGYDAEWRLVSAASVGAHHRRERIIIVAYPKSEHSNGSDHYSGIYERPETLSELGNSSRAKAMAERRKVFPSTPNEVWNTLSKGWERSRELQETETERSRPHTPSKEARWRGIWQPEPNVGRVAYGVSNRVDKLRGLGNAVVPQVAEVIGRLVMEHAS
jgi:DNA (cytosine-5)-methyltransferase 1